MSTRRKTKARLSGVMTLRLDPTMRARLERMREAMSNARPGISVSDIIREAVAEMLERGNARL